MIRPPMDSRSGSKAQQRIVEKASSRVTSSRRLGALFDRGVVYHVLPAWGSGGRRMVVEAKGLGRRLRQDNAESQTKSGRGGRSLTSRRWAPCPDRPDIHSSACYLPAGLPSHASHPIVLILARPLDTSATPGAGVWLRSARSTPSGQEPSGKCYSTVLYFIRLGRLANSG
nr:hypothetical protein CFP56_32221 [Quercus suber]